VIETEKQQDMKKENCVQGNSPSKASLKSADDDERFGCMEVVCKTALAHGNRKNLYR